MTRPIVEVATSLAAFEGMHTLVDNSKRVIKVKRDWLMTLLMDHSRMVGQLRAFGYVAQHQDEVSAEPEQPKRRKKREVVKVKPVKGKKTKRKHPRLF